MGLRVAPDAFLSLRGQWWGPPNRTGSVGAYFGGRNHRRRLFFAEVGIAGTARENAAGESVLRPAVGAGLGLTVDLGARLHARVMVNYLRDPHELLQSVGVVICAC